MLYELSEDQEEIRECVRRFGKKYLTRESVKQWRRDQGLPDEVVKAFVDLEFGPVALLADRERFKRPMTTLVLIIEELTRIAGAVLPFQTDLLNLCLLSDFAPQNLIDYARESFQETGRFAFSLAVSEPGAGSDIRSMESSIRRVGDKIILNGHKTFVNNGEYAPFILVAAVDVSAEVKKGRTPVSIWLVPNDAPGVRSYPIEKKGQRMLPFSELLFENVELEARSLMAGGEDGLVKLYRSFEMGRIVACSGSLGLAQAAMDDAMGRALERTAFGNRLYSFQQIESSLVDMEVRIANMRNLVYEAALSFDEDRADAQLTVALMKRYVPKTATEVADAAIQIFGGRGYTEKERVFSIWEDCRGNQIAEGTDEIMVQVGAPQLRQRYEAVGN